VVLTGWAYRKAVQVNTSSAYNHGLSHYAIKLKLYYSTGIDNASDYEIYLNQRCRTDFGDVRFTLPDDTLLPYWFEEIDGDHVVVWVRIPVSSSTTQIYIYYGNPNATYVGDPVQVFDFFDDFTTYRSNPNLWVNLTIKQFGGKNVMSVTPGAEGTDLLFPTAMSNFGAEFKYYIAGITEGGPLAWIDIYEVDTLRYYGLENRIAHLRNCYLMSYYDDTNYYVLVENGNAYRVGVWYRNYFYRCSATGKLVGKLGESTEMTATHTAITQFGDIWFATWDTSNEFYIDWIAIRPYVDPEPSLNAVSGEESLVVTYSFTDNIDITLIDDYSLTIKSPLTFTDLANVSITDNYIVSLGLIFTDLININITDTYMLKINYTFDDLLNITILDKYTLTVGVVGALEFTDTLSIDIKDVYYLKPPKPLANAYVEIYDENNNLVASGYTDSYGRVSFFIPIGKYRVRVSKESYETMEFIDVLSESKTRKVYLRRSG